MSVSGGGDLTITSPTQNTSFDWWTQDQAGHTTSGSFAITNLDRSAPTNPTGSAIVTQSPGGQWRLHRLRRSQLQLDGFCGCAWHPHLPGSEPVQPVLGRPIPPTPPQATTPPLPSVSPPPHRTRAYYLWAQSQGAAGNRSLWVKRFTYRYQSGETVRVFISPSPGLLYTVRWAEDSPTTRYTVKSLLPGGAW
ncbi:MAG: hypothetical protein PHQ40_05005 [Anaerolineaceae bacterium]|nr:hypothetical protein [Anaerolineaceae bacterium]